MDEDSLHVSVDEEGVVRLPELVAGVAVLIGKETLEKLLTEVYAQAFSDLEVERKERR